MDTLIPSGAMRDPAGNAAQYAEFFRSAHVLAATWNQELDQYPLHSQVSVRMNRMFDSQDYLLHQYGVGISLDEIRQSLLRHTAQMLDDGVFVRANGGAELADLYPLYGVKRRGCGFAALALLLVADSGYLASLRQLVSPASDVRGYLLDLLVHAFDPAHALAWKYKPNKYAAPWTDPVLRALAAPAPQRAALLASHMNQWLRLMRPFGWKPNRDTAPGKDNLFCDFAFEVALAVCAYDIDDSSFHDHPYYPRDLVQHYRQQVRQQRDGWRAEQAGAGVAVAAPAPAPKSDLAHTRRKGIARWLELVSDGDNDATDAVVECVGKPRKVKDLDALLCALQENGQAIHADIKDDDTLEQQAVAMGAARGLGDFEPPRQPPAGPARCSALLLAWNDWLAERGYHLVAIDGQDDSWHAVVVKAGYADELHALGAALGIAVQDPAQLYRDPS